MTEQQWNFAGIEAAASAIQGNVTSIHSLLDEEAVPDQARSGLGR